MLSCFVIRSIMFLLISKFGPTSSLGCCPVKPVISCDVIRNTQTRGHRDNTEIPMLLMLMYRILIFMVVLILLLQLVISKRNCRYPEPISTMSLYYYIDERISATDIIMLAPPIFPPSRGTLEIYFSEYVEPCKRTVILIS